VSASVSEGVDTGVRRAVGSVPTALLCARYARTSVLAGEREPGS
jgi:hypothetical protein